MNDRHAMQADKPLAVSIGEPAGLGPELILKAWAGRAHEGLHPFFVLGDTQTLSAHADMLGLDVPLTEARIDDVSEAIAGFDHALPVVQVSAPLGIKPGELTADGARLALATINAGVAAVLSGKASALVTSPIHKANLLDIGFSHPGHTEYLAVCAEREGAPPSFPVMMIATETFRVVPVTVHMPLSAVPSALTTELIERTARVVAEDLKNRFRIAAPRLALCGLNPHAGEAGHLGHEDGAIIRPAIEVLNAAGIAATGPHPADTLFHEAARARYDAALAMYHDQALIPIKTVAFDEAVNVTLGLPFIRTSPDHGTGLDIAGKGIARTTSFVAALKMAAKLASEPVT